MNNNNNDKIGEIRQSEVRRKTRLGSGLESLNVKPKKEKPLFFVNILIREKKYRQYCGEGQQKIRWLTDCAIYKYETETKKTETKPAGGNELSKDEVQGVIRASFAAVRTCSRSSAQKGQMKVSFVIKANGRVSNAKVVSPEFANTPAASCVLKVVNGLKFRESSKDTPITYPFQIQ